MKPTKFDIIAGSIVGIIAGLVVCIFMARC